MPIYEYECCQCGDTFERIQSFSDKPLKKCKNCGGRLQKLVSECSFHLKGTGWYVTDYGKSGNSRNAASAANSAKKESKATQKESESKPEAKTTETKASAAGTSSSSDQKA